MLDCKLQSHRLVRLCRAVKFAGQEPKVVTESDDSVRWCRQALLVVLVIGIVVNVIAFGRDQSLGLFGPLPS